MRVRLYLDAARNMRARQLVGRTRRLVPPALLAPGASAPAPEDARLIAGGLGADPAPQSGPTPPPHEVGEFTAVGHRRPAQAPDLWTDSSDGLLFLFSLHGFEALGAYAAGPRTPAGDAFWADVIQRWLADHSRPSLPAWHPFPTSNRIVAWCAALSAIGSWPSALRDRMTGEVWRQARYLRRAVEHDIGGNHVLKNAKALAVAGAVFPSSSLWPDGLALLRRELSSQILADGGHEERSTSYHRAVHQDLVEVAELAERRGSAVEPWLAQAIRQMAAWQAAMAGPDGRLPMLNDGWEGPRVEPDGDGPSTHLEASGYFVLRHQEDQVTLDTGPLCPDHLPAHAHADALSVVLWADGRPVVVDPGSYAYTGPFRHRLRSTSAHNTVEVDGGDQCELWGDFRAAYLPRVRSSALRRCGEALVIDGMHDGYRRLPDPVEHHRTLVWCPGEGAVIVDRLRAKRPHQVRSSLHLAPEPAGTGGSGAPDLKIATLGGTPEHRRTTGIFAPYLGTSVPAPVLETEAVIEPGMPFGWSLLRGDRQVSAVDAHRVVIDGGTRPPIEVPLQWA